MVLPDGGLVDNTPPVPESFSPPNASMNMHKTKIVVRFDEHIILDKLTQQLVVSPQMPENPEIHVQGKKLIIELPDSLRQNTTYTIFFGDAVINYKENLPVHNFSYVFSTGDVVDSLQLKGQAVNAFNHTPYEELFIMLYKSDDDSVLYKHKPYYLTKTEKYGSFFLNNLAPGKYQIYALKDANRNYIFDQAVEEIAFLDSLVIPYHPSTFVKDTADTTDYTPPPFPKDINLFVYTEKLKKIQYLTKKIYPPQKILFTFNRDIIDFRIIPLDFNPDTNWHYDVYNPNRDSVIVYLMGITKDTINVAIADGENILDSIQLVLKKKKKKRTTSRKKNRKKDVVVKKPKPKPIPKISYKNNLSSNFPFFGEIGIRFSIPLSAYNFDRIQLYKARDTLWVPIDFEAYLYDTINRQKIRIRAAFGEREKYKLLLRDSCFFDLYNATNDTLENEFFTTEMRQYGSMQLIVNYNGEGPLIVQLLNSSDAVIMEHFINSSDTINYPYLPEGKYKIKAISDKNNNRKWDIGDLQKRIQPEAVYYIQQLIDIRANWDNEQIWDIVE